MINVAKGHRQKMDLFLNFKNKNYEAKYFEDIDPYLTKVSKTCLIISIVIIPFYPYSLVVVFQNLKGSLTAQIVSSVGASLIFFLMFVGYFAVWKFRPVMKRHQNATRWALDLFFFAVGAFYVYYYWEFSSSNVEPLNSYYTGWFHALKLVTLLSPISRWYFKMIAILAVILRLGISTYLVVYNPFVMMKLSQLVLLEILSTYLSERDRRRYFIEKQALYDETKVYKEIFDSASDGVVIYGLTEGLLYTNWSSEKHRWRNSEQSIQESLERILIKGYKKMSFSSLHVTTMKFPIKGLIF